MTTPPTEPPAEPSAEPTTEPTTEAAPVVAPPRAKLLAYRLLGHRLPPEHHTWVLRDAASASFLTWRSLRTFVWGQAVLWLVLLGRWMTFDEWPSRAWLIRLQLVVLAVVLLSSRDALVRRVLRWHRIDKYGRPVENVKPFARLSNTEATALGAVVLLLCAAGGAVYGDFQRPRGVAAAPCREADPAVMDRIRAGQTNTKAKYVSTRMVVDGDVTIVLALTDTGRMITPTPAPGRPAPSVSPSPRAEILIELWLVRADGIERLANKESDATATTGFPRVENPDRGLSPAISRVAACLREEVKP